MRILIISWFFPPANTVAAVRLGGVACHLLNTGQEVRVITARDIPAQQTLANMVNEGRVHRTTWRQPLAWYRQLRGKIAHQPNRAGRADHTNWPPTMHVGSRRRNRPLWKALLRDQLFFPDKSSGWITPAVREGCRVCDGWQPDIVFASGPPFSTLVAAYNIARHAELPLVCEFRDRWWDDPYYPPTLPCTWRQRLLEWRIATYARGLTTVSEPWAETYRTRYRKPVAVVYNGFDGAVPPKGGHECAAAPAAFPGNTLNVLYTGGIYPGRRDPRPLFQALDRNSDLRNRVRIWFYGTAEWHVRPLADECGVGHCVHLEPAVAHDTAIQLQQRADILLLMQWNDPREQGNVPGKFFEYLGAGRPILLLGLHGGVPDGILRQRDAGVLANDPEAIAGHLTRWLELKDQNGAVPGIPPEARAGFERREQFEKLRLFLHEIAGDQPITRGGCTA